MKVRAQKSWRFSRHGYDVQTAAEGDTLDLPEALARDGIATGHLIAAPERQAAPRAPEAKAPARRKRKG